jgi:hypothetical protein
MRKSHTPAMRYGNVMHQLALQSSNVTRLLRSLLPPSLQPPFRLPSWSLAASPSYSIEIQFRARRIYHISSLFVGPFHLGIWLLQMLQRNCDPVSYELRFAQNKGALQRCHNAIPLHHGANDDKMDRSTALYPLASSKSLLEVADPKGDLPHSSLAPISMVVWSPSLPSAAGGPRSCGP